MGQNSPASAGKVILLNGPSSSGKSSIARELQARLPTLFLHLSFDHLRDSGVLPLERIQSGELDWSKSREAFFIGFERAVAALAAAGNNLIVDHIVETRECLGRLNEALSGIDVFFVGVHCPLDELERREAARGDRRLGDARRDHFSVHQHCTYDLEVDGTLSPEQNAAKIIEALGLDEG